MKESKYSATAHLEIAIQILEYISREWEQNPKVEEILNHENRFEQSLDEVVMRMMSWLEKIQKEGGNAMKQ